MFIVTGVVYNINDLGVLFVCYNVKLMGITSLGWELYNNADIVLWSSTASKRALHHTKAATMPPMATAANDIPVGIDMSIALLVVEPCR